MSRDRKIPGLRRFLIARMLYVDGLTIVFAFIGWEKE